MSNVVMRWARGEAAPADVMDQVNVDRQALAARKSAAAAYGQGGGVKVLPLYGIITSRGNVMNEMSGPGSVSTQMFLASLRDALADDSVGAIVVDIDSPGGSVYQIQEVGDEIYKARSQKPIYGVSNCLAASAAYWLGTQCTHLYCTPSGEVGSIGVLAVHEDWSEANKMAGVKPTYIAAGPYKTEMNSDEPLSDDARAYQQSRIDDYYSMFVKAVARGRNASVADVRSKMGGGRVLGADDAFAVNMTCGTYSFDEVIKKARAAAKGPKPASALAGPSRATLVAPPPPVRTLVTAIQSLTTEQLRAKESALASRSDRDPVAKSVRLAVLNELCTRAAAEREAEARARIAALRRK
jgi:signal peptide peptidase SppA